MLVKGATGVLGTYYCSLISADIIKLMYERDQVHKTATKNKDPGLYEKYKRLGIN